MTTTLTASGPEDLLAAVPVVLGFHPSESLVMLTFGATRTFHARVDLPPPGDAGAVTEVVDALLVPSLAHEVARVAFVVYSGEASLAASLAAGLVPAFVADGIDVVDVIRAHDGWWCRVPVRARARESPPLPYDDTHHRFSAQAVFEGRVTLGSREELRATVAPDLGCRDRWSALVDELPEPGPAEVARARALVAAWVSSGADPDDEGAAQVLAAVTRPDVRDVALHSVTRDSARDHLRVWAALLRGAPDRLVADTAAVTAFCAWQVRAGCAGLVRPRPRPRRRSASSARAVPRRVPHPCPAAERLGGGDRRRATTPRERVTPPSGRFPGLRGFPRVTAWGRTSTLKSSPGRTARAIARRSTAVSTCSSGCSASTRSTPTTR